MNIFYTYNFLILIIFIVNFKKTISLGTRCNQYIQDSYFTLDTLKSSTDYNYEMSDGTTVFWNFCDFAHHKCLDDGRNAYAVKGIVDENYDTDNDSPDEDDIEECVRLTSDQKLSDYE